MRFTPHSRRRSRVNWATFFFMPRGYPKPTISLVRRLTQRLGGGDVRQMRQPLREVPHGLAHAGVELLGEEAEVVRCRERAVEHLPRLLHAALVNQALGQPEGAGDEGALAPADSVRAV